MIHSWKNRQSFIILDKKAIYYKKCWYSVLGGTYLVETIDRRLESFIWMNLTD